MRNEITLIKNNDNRDWSDQEWIEEFYEFLQGNKPDNISAPRGHFPKLTKKKAFSIIWYLQEHFPILPDNIYKCWNCGDLFDSHCEGLYWESKGRNYCGGCEYLVPENHDNCHR